MPWQQGFFLAAVLISISPQSHKSIIPATLLLYSAIPTMDIYAPFAQEPPPWGKAATPFRIHRYAHPYISGPPGSCRLKTCRLNAAIN